MGLAGGMNVALRRPVMTRDEFLEWAQHQAENYEFDGVQPVAMVRTTRNHGRICQNLGLALGTRLAGSAFEVFGQDVGVATIGNAVRYPDVMVARIEGRGTDLLIPGVVVVFEVLSPSSGRNDRITKLLEYRAVPSMRRYVIAEFDSASLSVFHRTDGDNEWTAIALTSDDVLRMPEIGIGIPVAELYARVDLPSDPAEV